MKIEGLKKATRWEMKDEGGVRSIQLYDEAGQELRGEDAYWEGDFICSEHALTSLKGSPKKVEGKFDCSWTLLTSRLRGLPSLSEAISFVNIASLPR